MFKILIALVLAATGVGSTNLYSAPQDEVESVDSNEIQRIAGQVQRAIVRLPNYGVFDDIRFEIQGRNVVLSGSASRPTLKTSSERVVRRIEGVEKVENKIEVLPNSPNDDRIRAGVYARIYGHPALSRYNPNRGTPRWITPGRIAAGITNDPPIGFHPIHIIVSNGNVRLEGVVDTIADRTIAGMQANSTPGAFSVENDLVVANEAARKMEEGER